MGGEADRSEEGTSSSSVESGSGTDAADSPDGRLALLISSAVRITGRTFDEVLDNFTLLQIYALVRLDEQNSARRDLAVLQAVYYAIPAAIDGRAQSSDPYRSYESKLITKVNGTPPKRNKRWSESKRRKTK